MVKRKKKKEKKEIHEIVEIKKDGKEIIKEFKGVEKQEHATKEQIKRQKKQLNIIFGILGIFVLIFLIFLFFSSKTTNFNYENLQFKKVQEGKITFYQTPMITQENGSKRTYNFYLRTNPNKLKKIPFEGNISLTNNLILNVTTENLFCDGDWQIAIGNLMNLNIFNIEVGKDENASCDSKGRYTFVQISEGNESKIEQYGPSCYHLYVADCEILPVTEKFMVETFLKINEFAKDYKWT